MSGKGAKGLIMGKSSTLNGNKDKDKKKPISRSSRAGLQPSFESCHLLPLVPLHATYSSSCSCLQAIYTCHFLAYSYCLPLDYATCCLVYPCMPPVKVYQRDAWFMPHVL
uniref:Uncharacterized protein n=1 Tax=Vitis vinifera TaxID=29760 RepID=F6HX80_VITVI